ncbi:GNAT family N-acetyltransferase [Clostridium sp. MSJ-4]|uniref:GNAT family N-acetyltransferase n=1 Tax=Clostridium simiarum TaxID=2841506 RepID=A0ABS6EWT1_9CLOT|nr:MULTISPECIES: GNAT family N-acetyltransferase [Clostridium]MBU5590683.1 GNAT family N-acetyltransferase [Clostridium simiarum]
MYNCAKLSKKNCSIFTDMLKRSREFNKLNKDYYNCYKNYSALERILMKSSTLLLKDETGYIGYLWYEKLDKKDYTIHSMWIKENINLSTINNYLKIFKKEYNLFYECKSNSYNSKVLSKLGFIKTEGSIELLIKVDSDFKLDLIEDLEFEIFQEGRQEPLRCLIQNEIFKNKNRIPLVIEDIIFDENQDYYIKSGGVFLKYRDEYIGYGQLILDDDAIIIVNFGVIPKFRGRGYSKLLIKKLLSMAQQKGYSNIKIKVANNNVKALNLYKSIGFNFNEEISLWQFKYNNTNNKKRA